jgi:hypothetical protein
MACVDDSARAIVLMSMSQLETSMAPSKDGGQVVMLSTMYPKLIPS